jgi:hypothetical protein
MKNYDEIGRVPIVYDEYASKRAKNWVEQQKFKDKYYTILIFIRMIKVEGD